MLVFRSLVIFFVNFLFLRSLTADENAAVGLYFQQEPHDAIVQRGERFVLHCLAATSVSARITVQYEWYHENVLLVESNGKRILRNGTLIITRFVHRQKDAQQTVSSEGRYHCLARIASGAIISRTATLTLARLSATVPEEDDLLTRAVGESVRLTCNVHGSPTPSIAWQKDEQPLRVDPKRFTVLQSGVLQITNITFSEAGSYRCNATNVARQLFSGHMHLSIVTRPSEMLSHQFVVEPSDVASAAGSDVLLECLSTGNPQPRMAWKRDGRRLMVDNRRVIVGRGNLLIRQLMPDDEGNYVCESTVGGRTLTSIPARLSVVVPPRVWTKEPFMKRNIAHIARLTCECSGNPEPNVTWFKNGLPVDATQGPVKIRGCQLVISQVAIKDSGFYQCRAQNEGGSTQATIQLFVPPSNFAPDPPMNVRALSMGSTSVELVWQESRNKHGYQTTVYTVHFALAAGGQERQKVVQNRSVLIDHLLPFSNYTFYVIAYNNVTASPHSEKITVQTAEDVPLTTPTVNLSHYGATAIKVTWSLLPLKKARGHIVEYKLFYRLSDKPITSSVETIDGQVREFIITGLEPKQNYDCLVLAATVGYPVLESDWPWSTIKTLALESRSVEAPHVTIQSVNVHSVSLSWPSVVDAIGYKIDCHAVDSSMDDFKSMMILPATTLFFTLQNLTFDTLYKVTVSVVLTSGEGRSTFRHVRTQNQTSGNLIVEQLPIIHSVEANAINETSIYVSWKEPVTMSELSHYVVHYEPVRSVINTKSSGSLRFPYSLISNITEAYLNDLEPATNYAIVITYETSVGESGPSQEVFVRTPDDPFSDENLMKPDQVSVTLTSPTSVKVKWKEPIYLDDPVTQYAVWYTHDMNLPSLLWNQRYVNVTHVFIDDLEPDSQYYFKIVALTELGTEQPSNIVSISTRSADAASSTEGAFRLGERELGIILGVCIGLGCVIICITLLLVQNRCLKKRRLSRSHRSHRGAFGSQASNVGHTVSPGPSLPELSHVLITPCNMHPKPGQQFNLNGYVLTAPNPHYPTLSHDITCFPNRNGIDSSQETPQKEEINDDDLAAEDDVQNQHNNSGETDDDVFERSAVEDENTRMLNAEDVNDSTNERRSPSHQAGEVCINFSQSNCHAKADYGEGNRYNYEEGAGEVAPLLFPEELGQRWMLQVPVEGNRSSISSSVRSSDCYSESRDESGVNTSCFDPTTCSQDLPPPTDDIRLDSYRDVSDDAEESSLDGWSESNDTATLPLRMSLGRGITSAEV